MKLLIVEDEKRLLDFLTRTLGENGYTVTACGCLEDLECVLAQQEWAPDLILLDRLLHQEDSLSMVPALRRVYPRAGILILSAVNVATDKASALDSGADDYLAKPFSSVELLARLRALARRDNRSPSHLKVGNLVVEISTRVVMSDSRRLNLSNKEFHVLFTLLQRPGKVFNKMALLEQVWDMNADCDSNVVETTISNLRKKLQDGGSSVAIQNMRNVGYWIEA